MDADEDYGQKRFLAGALLVYYANELVATCAKAELSAMAVRDTPFYDTEEMEFFGRTKEKALECIRTAHAMMGLEIISMERKDIANNLLTICDKLAEFDHVRRTMEE